MVNYVCRTCLYVGDIEFSFRKLEKVKKVLELFVPEIRNYIGKYSLICEQCYYFLKNVEYFKIRCMETQNKLYTMNIETIRDNHTAILQSLVDDASARLYRAPPPPYSSCCEQVFHKKLSDTPSKSKIVAKKAKRKRTVPTLAAGTSNSVVQGSIKPSAGSAASLCYPLPTEQIEAKKAKQKLAVPTPAAGTSNSVVQDSIKPCFGSAASLCYPLSTKRIKAKKSKRKLVVPKPAAGTSNSVVQGSVKPSVGSAASFSYPLSTELGNKAKQSTTQHSSNSDELLQLFNCGQDFNELQNFREYAVKPTNPNIGIPKVTPTIDSDKDFIMNYIDDSVNDEDEANNNDDDAQEYLTKKDLVAAGILSDHDECESTETGKESHSDDNMEVVDIDISEDGENSPGKNTGRVEIKIACSNKQTKSSGKEIKSREKKSDDVRAVVKTETEDEDNPGFFNKQSADGFYKCRLCAKRYKTSKGLYNHTKEKHGNQVRFHHCDHCSFFTLWKSALMRHYSVFHGNIFEQMNPSPFRCYHCSFKSSSKDKLSCHIIGQHANEKKVLQCTSCKASFTDNTLFAQHVEKEHLALEMPTSSHYCPQCSVIFLTNNDYKNHMQEKHEKHMCVTCNTMFGLEKELHEHQRNAHATSFGASVLP